MPRATQNLKAFDPDESDCRRLIEALADGNPIPDTSTICPDRHRLIILLAEISKVERSELFPHTRQIAERQGLSAHEIASRAAFLLACLDTPGVDDPYIILGVAPTATSEEIKEVWLSRLSLYHPDRHPENTDWFTRQAARLNEAYQILKDPARRHAYDERRRRKLLARQQSGPFAIQPVASALPSFMPSLASLLTRHRAPTLITIASVVAAGLAVVALFDRPSEGPQLYLETVQPMAAVSLPAPPPISGPLPPPGPIRAEPPALDTPVTHHVDHQPERKRTKRVRQVTLRSSLPAGQSDPSDLPVLDTQTGRPTVPEPPAEDPILLAQALPPIVAEPKGLDRQEIDALLDEYIDAYEKADVDRLMVTLSPRVREKGTLDYQAIRNLYAKGFAGREQIIYRIKNIQVEIKGEQATATAQYLISARNAAQASKGTTVSGRIEWKIQLEGNRAKIVAINY